MLPVLLSFLVGLAIGIPLVNWVSQKTINAQRKQIEQNHRLMAELEKSHETRMQEVIKDITEKHQDELKQQRKPLEDELETLRQKHQQELNDLAQEHWNMLESFQTERSVEVANLKQAHQSALQAVNQELAANKQKFQSDMKAIQRQFQQKLENDVESARVQFQVVLDQFIADHQAGQGPAQPADAQEQNPSSTVSDSGEATHHIETTSSTTSSLPTEAAVHELVTHHGGGLDAVDVKTDKTFEPPAVPVIEETSSFELPASVIEGTEEMPSLSMAVNDSSSLDSVLMAINDLGQSQNVSAIGQLSQQAKTTNPNARVAIATALGQIIAANRQSPRVQQSIPVLTQLSKDTKPAVRQAAVSALGGIPSVKVVPVVKRALLDPDTKVVKAATQAMEKLKPFRKTK